jgi:hypothetical protein
MKFRTAKKIWNRANQSSGRWARRGGMKYYNIKYYDWCFYFDHVTEKLQRQVWSYYSGRGLHHSNTPLWKWPDE